MTKKDRNVIDYVVVCISEFANRYGMNMRDAYIYLERYNEYYGSREPSVRQRRSHASGFAEPADLCRERFFT